MNQAWTAYVVPCDLTECYELRAVAWRAVLPSVLTQAHYKSRGLVDCTAQVLTQAHWSHLTLECMVNNAMWSDSSSVQMGLW